MIRHRPDRRGGVAVWALIVLPVLVFLAWLGITTCEVSLLIEQSRRTADACAVDATSALVCDAMLEARLYGRGRHLDRIADEAYDRAEWAADRNPVFGQPLIPDRNSHCDPRGEFVLGTVSAYAYGATFDPAGSRDLERMNAVQIRYDRRARNGIPVPGGFREDLVVTATAMLDDAASGFRPVSDVSVLPVAPIAIDRRAWDEGIDGCGSSGLPDIELRLMAGPDPNPHRNLKPTAVPLTIGTRNVAELVAQLATGVRSGEYARFVATMNGPFELHPATGRLVIPGDRYAGSALGPIREAFESLRQCGEVRAWPTTVQFAPSNDRLVWATGFVGARVVRVKADEITYKPIPWLPFTLRVKVLDVALRPAMICTPMIVTRPGTPANPYLCTVRLLTAQH